MPGQRRLESRHLVLAFLLFLSASAFGQHGPALFKVTITPGSWVLAPGKSFQFRAERTFFRGDSSAQLEEDVTNKAVWSSLDPTLATASASTPGLITANATKTGTVTIQAVLGPFVATAQLTVSSTVVLNSITVTPATQVVVLAAGVTVPYTATGNYSDNSTQSLTSTATWKSSATVVATMSSNVANVAGAGDTAITATLGPVTGSANLNVVPKLTVMPATATIDDQQTEQFSANLPVNWSVDGIAGGNATVGTVSGAGFYAPTAASVGAHTVTATTIFAPAQQASAMVQVSAFTGVLTYHNDNLRSGLNPNEVVLTPSNVNAATFGLKFILPSDGLVDAEPLYAPNITIPGKGTHNVVVVASEHDTVFVYDADTGALYWQKTMLLGNETPSDDRGCNQVTPEIGITATPVIDLSRGPNGTIYVVAMSKDANSNYFQRLHALDLTTGAEEFGGPVTIQGMYPGTGDNSNGTDVIFDPSQYKERDGMLALNGKIYLAWASHCDIQPYTGWVMAYDESTLAQTSVIDTTPNATEGGYWNSGGGFAADANGNIYQLIGNGTFDGALNAKGFPSMGDYGNAFIKLSTSAGLAVADYFEMYNQLDENNNDVDLGSGGAMLLPDQIDAQGHTRHLAVGAGKDGNLYMVDRDNMGKYVPNATSNTYIYQELVGALGGIYSSPAYFNGTVYYGPVGNQVEAFQLSQALLNPNPTSISAQSYEYPGATPSISSTGTSNAILWVTENTNPAVLHAYDANNLANELYNSTQAAGGRDTFGNGNKFITPMIGNGKVYVGTMTGVGVFGLL